jgi:hypothetical protein
MATYLLLDTGYANTGANGTQETRANGGSALSLDVTNLDWYRKTGFSDNPNPGRYQETNVNYVSVLNPTLRLNGVLQINSTNYETDVAALDDMCTTKGLKLFYYSSSTDGFKPITQIKGETSYGSLQVDGATKALLVKVLDFRLSEPPKDPTKSLRGYTITLEVTNPNA